MTARTFETGFEPTLAEFKSNIRLTTDTMDADLTLKLKASILSAEHYIGKVIAQSTFTITTAYAKTTALPEPLIEVSSVVVDGAAVTDYTLKGNELTLAQESGETMTITCKAGMASVPEDIKAAVILHASALFNNPVDSVEVMPKASTRLLDAYRTWGR